MNTVAAITFAATALIILLAGHAFGQVYSLDASGAHKLRQILESHVYYGLPVTREMRAATGDANIMVIERRQYGRVSKCSYLYRGDRRQLLCNS